MATGETRAADWWKSAKSVYEFSAKDIDGNEVSLDKCLTEKNYTQLQQLHAKFAEEKGLRILGFPCNQFASQEPGTEAEIKEFATSRFGVQFDMFSKIDVNGSNAHPLFSYLKMKQSGWFGNFIKWNFTKFLIDKRGQPVKRYSPKDAPLDIEKDLAPLW